MVFFVMAYPIASLLVGVCFRPQLLDAQEEAHSVSHLVDAHLLEDLLIYFQEVRAIDVVPAKYLLVLAALDAP